MNVRPPIASCLLAFAVAACGTGGRDAGPPPLQGAAIGGPFALVDQDGKPATERRFTGKYRVFYFGYTYCPDVCPTTLQKVMAGYHQFAKQDPGRAARVVPVFVTVDPARDTPPVMKQYVGAFGPGLVGLTGSAAEIAQAAKEYGVYYKVNAPEKGASGYLVDHSSQAILFGPDGKPIVIVPTDKDGSDATAAIADTFAQWVS